MTRRHTMPYQRYKEMLTWLEENVQPNYHKTRDQYASSSVSQFIEWRSVDKESWILRIAGNPAKVYVEIKDPKKEVLFLLVWQ